MRHRHPWLALVLVGGLAACEDGPVVPPGDPLEARIAGSEHGGRPFPVPMTGAEEAPGPGDPDGSGTAFLTMNAGQEEVCWEITVADITLPATAAHIHIGAAGEPGPPVVTLSAPDESARTSGCADADRELIEAIFEDPSGYYVNVHTTDFPGGAVRGQLH